MKIINFTAVEILTSLLDKTKTQTIRPAWVSSKKGERHTEDVREKSSPGSSPGSPIKPVRFKVGEEVKLMWNQRSKYKWFCSVCGGKVDLALIYLSFTLPPTYFRCCSPITDRMNKCYFFNKTLGTAKITEVFKITMMIDENNRHFICVEEGGESQDTIVLAKRDGFDSVEEMMDWLDKKYRLDTWKEFWVYRWEVRR